MPMSNCGAMLSPNNGYHFISCCPLQRGFRHFITFELHNSSEAHVPILILQIGKLEVQGRRQVFTLHRATTLPGSAMSDFPSRSDPQRPWPPYLKQIHESKQLFIS